jgi:hypothetical protein
MPVGSLKDLVLFAYIPETVNSLSAQDRSGEALVMQKLVLLVCLLRPRRHKGGWQHIA